MKQNYTACCKALGFCCHLANLDASRHPGGPRCCNYCVSIHLNASGQVENGGRFAALPCLPSERRRGRRGPLHLKQAGRKICFRDPKSSARTLWYPSVVQLLGLPEINPATLGSPNATLRISVRGQRLGRPRNRTSWAWGLSHRNQYRYSILG
ncbi:hypothetical protein PsYK624_052430 [Phanerochaete sordida]|uniref:Uncharacterized protein n=1 Tax=Phanerochaete sordida TaxID=48140 RepID=A0A9P3G849_9APHY|nr:hypothetical protein PsYK624_052430 [Phanerochaete sordida]